MGNAWMLVAAVAGWQGSSTAPGNLPALPATKLCADGATIRARDRCPPPLHSSKTDHGLRAEFRIVLACSRPPGRPSEQVIEDSLYGAGFDTLNRRRLTEEASNLPFIEAIRDGQFIWVNSAPSVRQPGAWLRVFISLYSRPQRAADTRLSRRLQRLASRIEPRSCRVEKVTRDTNDASSAWTFDDLAYSTRYHFKEARRRDPTSTAYRIHPAASDR